MFEVDHRFYYEKRAEQATELGYRATEPKVAALHFELALRYEILAVQSSHARPEIVALASNKKAARVIARDQLSAIMPN